MITVLQWIADHPKAIGLLVAILFEGWTVFKNLKAQRDKTTVLLEAYGRLKLYKQGMDILTEGIEEATEVFKQRKVEEPDLTKRIVERKGSGEVAGVIHKSKQVAEGATVAIDVNEAEEFANSFVKKAGVLSILNPFK